MFSIGLFLRHKLKIKYLPVRNRLFKVYWCMQNLDNLTEFCIDIQRQNTLFNVFNNQNLVSSEEFQKTNPKELL